MELAAILISIFFLCLLLWAYLSDKVKHREIIDKQNLLNTEIGSLKKKIERYEETMAMYRQTYRENVDSYNTVQEHMAKIREQMQRLHKRQNIIKQGMVKRFEVVVPNDFKDHLRTVAKKLEQFS